MQNQYAASMKALATCSAILSEHFDSTLILVSKLESDGTTRTECAGSGNAMTKIGMAKNFLDKDVAEINAEANEFHEWMSEDWDDEDEDI